MYIPFLLQISLKVVVKVKVPFPKSSTSSVGQEVQKEAFEGHQGYQSHQDDQGQIWLVFWWWPQDDQEGYQEERGQ